jgi:catechol 2,3-dioxygenase-like lactoylglutathione lyase family enzyme
MPPASCPATYKDLCVDAADPVRLGRFWSAVLGWRLHEHDDGDADLRDADGRVQVWLNRVPEPRSVKNRLHLDVGARSVQDLLALGATRAADQPDHGRWTVLHDPDGQELCVFVDDDPSRDGLQELAWDVSPALPDATRAARWWAEVLGARVVEHDGWTQVLDVPGAPFSGMAFNPVPEPRTAKNRIHVDVLADGVEELVARGATVLRPKGDDGLAWHVLADPEGDEFCVFDRPVA